MSPVFAHGRLRLYLLTLLAEAPRHGYEVIRLLEERFHGLYAPSAGTVYPRLAKLEQEGLVTHSTEGGRKVYRLTDAGRRELADRQDEIAALEAEIHDSVGRLAEQIREDVRDSARDLREEMRRAAKESRQDQGPAGHERGSGPWFGPGASPRDREAWRQIRREWAQARGQAREQARQAAEQMRQAHRQARAAEEDARRTRADAQAARAEALRLKRRVEQQVREYAARGDWPAGLAEGLAELGRGLAGLADPDRWIGPGARRAGQEAGRDAAEAAGRCRTRRPSADAWAEETEAEETGTAGPAAEGTGTTGRGPCRRPGWGGPWRAWARPEAELPEWARTDPDGDPVRELERLLDRFRDRVRDAARDTGVPSEGLARCGSVLAGAAAAVGRILGREAPPEEPPGEDPPEGPPQRES